MPFKTVVVDEMLARRQINEIDVVRLDDAFQNEGALEEADARVLLALDASSNQKHTTWLPFYIGAVCDYLLHQSRPEGYLTVEKADWLMSAIAPAGRLDSKSNLDLAITILTHARWAPERLVCFLLAAVRDDIAGGERILRGTPSSKPGQISECDVDLLRRILYAQGGTRATAITRSEAAMLIAIDEVATHAPPDWSELFSKAITSAALTASGYIPPVREVALALDGRLRAASTAFRPASAEDVMIAGLERQRLEIITREAITVIDVAWLSEALSAARAQSPARTALQKALAEEGIRLHPALRVTTGQQGRAASRAA
jgi:hypothetical protein